MVDQSLIQYLLSKTNTKENKIRALVSIDESDDEKFPLDDKEKEKIVNALDEVKIIDPACGSGAFPIGILQKIVLMLGRIDTDGQLWLEKKTESLDPILRQKILKENEAKNFDYIRKLGIIKDSIFGVDIQPIAVEVSKLRCFLTLIVDENIDDHHENRGIEPLPNLEFKFVAANTLVDLPGSKNNSLFEDKEQIKKLKLLKDQYFVSNGYDKEKIKSSFKDVQREMFKKQVAFLGQGEMTMALADWNPFSNKSSRWFDPEWMFGIKYFDVIIGNPPYGFRNVLSAEEKRYFRKVKGISFSSGDSAELFCKYTFDNLLSNNGILSFIIPKKSLYGEAWEDFRRNYWLEYNLNFLLDSSKAFGDVLLEANAFGLSKNKNESLVECSYLSKKGSIVLIGQGKKSNIFLENSTAQVYLLKIPKTLWEKINNRKNESSLVSGKLGLAIGKPFYSETNTEYKLLKGIDIGRWKIKTHRWLRNIDKLDWKQAEEFLSPKIVAQRLVAHIENPIPHIKITACRDIEGIIITNTLMSFELDDRITPEFWVSYLNSRFVSWYMYNFIYSRAIRGMDLYNFYLQQLPVPKKVLDPKEQEIFKDIVISIESLSINQAKNNDESTLNQITNYEREIDQLIYQLYDLSPEEIRIIEGK